MEKPYVGRATLRDTLNGLEIAIPSKKNWFIIIFMGAWLGGWFMGEAFAIGALTGLFGDNPAGLFILFWLVAWTAGGFFALRTFLWMIAGKELLLFERGHLTIDKKGALLVKSRTYDLRELKNIRISDNGSGNGVWGYQQNSFISLGTNGTIKFDYGLKTVRIADGIDEAEAKFIIEKLKEKRILDENNYAQQQV